MLFLTAALCCARRASGYHVPAAHGRPARGALVGGRAALVIAEEAIADAVAALEEGKLAAENAIQLGANALLSDQLEATHNMLLADTFGVRASAYAADAFGDSGAPHAESEAAPPSTAVAVDDDANAAAAPRAGLRARCRRKLTAAKRSGAIWTCAASFALRVALQRRRFANEDDPEEATAARRQLAAEFRDALLRLGPTFIKFGQLLSTRVDVLQAEVIEELSTLQNTVPGFAPSRAIEIIKQELGLASLDQVFATFESKPLAAASLAQVHRATLLNGDEVVVKVQRDGLREAFDIDCANIRFLAACADRLDPENEGVSSNWRGIAETSEGVLYREIDFTIEREAAERFRLARVSSARARNEKYLWIHICGTRSFLKKKKNAHSIHRFEEGAGSSKPLPYVKVPKTYNAFCTSRVLVLEYVAGIKISDVETIDATEGLDRQLIAERLTTSYLEQLCRHGFFHCDPHPGNVAVDLGYPGGRIVYYDFGMMEFIERDVKKGFVDLVYSLYKNQPVLACDALEQMGVLRPGLDRFSVERIARSYLKTFASTIERKNAKTTIGASDAKWENEMSAEEVKAERRARRAQIGADLFATQAERPFVFPPKFTFVFRAITTIDGIGKNLDSSYDLTRISQPYLRELSDLRDGSRFLTAVGELGERLGWRPLDIKQLVQQPRAVATVRDSIKRIEDGELKLRVRSLEVERMLERVEQRQQLYGTAGAAVVAHHLSTEILSGALLCLGGPFSIVRALASRSASFLALALAADTLRRALQLQKLERRRLRFETDSMD